MCHPGVYWEFKLRARRSKLEKETKDFAHRGTFWYFYIFIPGENMV